MPRFSDSTRPASLSFAMWCEMVGWVRPRPAVKSQMQIGAAALHSEATIVSRVGSPNAFIRSARLSAQVSLTRGRLQHTPLTLSPAGERGMVFNPTTPMLQYPSTNIDGLEEQEDDERSHRSRQIPVRERGEADRRAAGRVPSRLLRGRRPRLRLRGLLPGGGAEGDRIDRLGEPRLRQPDHARRPEAGRDRARPGIRGGAGRAAVGATGLAG